jgi:hypothetical protein
MAIYQALGVDLGAGGVACSSNHPNPRIAIFVVPLADFMQRKLMI